jgi:hypothetical protein
MDSRRIQCDECGAIGFSSQRDFPHKGPCSIGLCEQGRECPACHSSKVEDNGAPNKLHIAFCCLECGEQWDPMDLNRDPYSPVYDD